LAGLVAALAAGRTTGHFERGSARALVPIVLIAAAMLVAQTGAGRFGLGLAALGATCALRIAPSSGVCGAPLPETLAEAEAASAGVGRGVAAAAAALTAMVLFGLYLDGAPSGAIAFADPDVAAGLLVGAALPFAFSRAPGAGAGDRASTPFALRAMIVAGLVAVAAPLVVGRLDPAALCGLLAGAIACGVLLALIVSDAALDTLIKLTSLVAIVATRR
jgi:K(+)-stimulated pyrophosphate-energized sodium pump